MLDDDFCFEILLMTDFMYPDYPFQSHYYKRGDHTLHFVDEGEGSVIVMVHGNPTWSFYYRRLITQLSKTHRVIAMDHMGCGLSDKPQDYTYTLQNHIDNLSALLQHLDIGKYSLVVHDWGGAIGIGAAARNPDMLEKLLVLNTAAFRSMRIPFRIRICGWPFIGQLLVRGLNAFAGPAVTMAVSKKMDKDVASAFVAPYNSWKNRVAVAAFVKDIPRAESHPSYASLLHVEEGLEVFQKRKLPVMICWGGKDFCFNDGFYKEWCSRFPHAVSHYFADSGHYVLEDSFAEIAPLAQDFFADEE